MSVGLDSEGLLMIYADWISFLREKQGQFAGQLAKLQGKGSEKEKTPPVPELASPAEPAPASTPVVEAGIPAPDDAAAPAWLFETAPAPDAETVPVVSPSAPDEEGDAWM